MRAFIAILFAKCISVVCAGAGDVSFDFAPQKDASGDDVSSKMVFESVVPYDKNTSATAGEEDESTVTYNETAVNLLMFENFVLTKQVFVKELKLVGQLRKMKQQLQALQKAARSEGARVGKVCFGGG